jgi:hypothetical protein
MNVAKRMRKFAWQCRACEDWIGRKYRESVLAKEVININDNKKECPELGHGKESGE